LDLFNKEERRESTANPNRPEQLHHLPLPSPPSPPLLLFAPLQLPIPASHTRLTAPETTSFLQKKATSHSTPVKAQGPKQIPHQAMKTSTWWTMDIGVSWSAGGRPNLNSGKPSQNSEALYMWWYGLWMRVRWPSHGSCVKWSYVLCRVSLILFVSLDANCKPPV
jgi:hypothetical protein